MTYTEELEKQNEELRQLLSNAEAELMTLRSKKKRKLPKRKNYYTPDVSAPSKCPQPWYGPDDFEEGQDPKEETLKREAMIEEWKEEWNKLSWFQRTIRSLKDRR